MSVKVITFSRQAWLHRPVIPATWEIEGRRIQVQNLPRVQGEFKVSLRTAVKLSQNNNFKEG